MNAMHKQAMSQKEAKALAATAGTPAEHHKLAAYYDAQARKLATQADEHAADGNDVDGGQVGGAGGVGMHGE